MNANPSVRPGGVRPFSVGVAACRAVARGGDVGAACRRVAAGRACASSSPSAGFVLGAVLGLPFARGRVWSSRAGSRGTRSAGSCSLLACPGRRDRTRASTRCFATGSAITGLPLGRLAVFLAPRLDRVGRAAAAADRAFPGRPSAVAALARTLLGCTSAWLAVGWPSLAVWQRSTGHRSGRSGSHIRDGDARHRASGSSASARTSSSVLVLPVICVFCAGLGRPARSLAYRRATGERRQQLKWLMSGGAVCVIGWSRSRSS